LLDFFPDQQSTLDELLSQTVAELPGAGAAAQHRIASGLNWGAKVADDIVQERSTDGINTTPPPYTPSGLPGRWQPAPPTNAGPTFRQFATMVPFAMESPGQFLPPPPPALTSAHYAQDLAEVEAYGSAVSTVRTPYQTETAQLVAAASPTEFWNQVADAMIRQYGLGVSAAAQVLARVNIAQADAAIAVWNAKNYYDTWRPITAIRQADTDGNPATQPDPGWTPFFGTPPFQDYPSGHAGVSSAGAAVLADRFGAENTVVLYAAALPGVVHTFSSFGAAVAEIGSARVWEGIHFRYSCDAAITMGQQVAAYVDSHDMVPVGD
jgi:membrane-associated phospholipid phosphatase